VATSRTPLARLRRLCLALPEAHEVEAWGEPTFRVRHRMFAMHAWAATHHGAGRPAVWLKSQHVVQDMLVRGGPARYFVPPYVGKSGWVGAYLDRVAQWDVLHDLLHDAYALVAPKSLTAGATPLPRRKR
jgi:predicted DNA-binding protein (MmcQ/YjbR family)